MDIANEVIDLKQLPHLVVGNAIHVAGTPFAVIEYDGKCVILRISLGQSLPF